MYFFTRRYAEQENMVCEEGVFNKKLLFVRMVSWIKNYFCQDGVPNKELLFTKISGDMWWIKNLFLVP